MNAVKPIQFIYGNQQLQIDETVAALVQTLLENREAEFTVQRFDVSELLKEDGESADEKVDHFCLSCDTLPFLSDRKIIRLEHLEKLKLPRGQENESQDGGSRVTSPSMSAGKRLFHAMQKYLLNPPHGCFFILTAFATRDQDLSTPLLKAIKQQGRIQKFVAYDDDNPIAWTIARGRQKQLSMTPQLARLLIELVGNDLNVLDQELEKLSLLSLKSVNGDEPRPQSLRLKEETLLEHVRGAKSFSIFRITQSLSNKDLVGALETLDQILLGKPSGPIGLFVLVYRQFRTLLRIHYFKQQNLPPPTILSKLQLHPFLGKRLVAQAQSFTLDELEQIVIHMAELDLQIKYNAKVARSLLQNLFQQICTGHFQSPMP